MNWLVTHVYIAAWASPIIALIGLLIRNRPTSAHPVPWPQVMIYTAFLTCLAAVITPGIDNYVRFFAGFNVSFMLGYFMMHR
jgi:hypothetical protein